MKDHYQSTILRATTSLAQQHKSAKEVSKITNLGYRWCYNLYIGVIEEGSSVSKLEQAYLALGGKITLEATHPNGSIEKFEHETDNYKRTYTERD